VCPRWAVEWASSDTLAPLVGRASELAVLLTVAAEAGAGQERIAVLEGEGGIGKSRLLREALAFAERSGFLILVGGCDEIEQGRPLGALVDSLGIARGAPDADRAELARVLRSGSDGLAKPAYEPRSADAGWTVVEAVVDVVEGLASKGPVALALEDLQWADPLTVRALHAVARHLVDLPLALFVTVRSRPRAPEIDRAIVDLLDRGARHVVVPPLVLDDAMRLAGQLIGLPVGPRLSDQVAGAGGNPLFVIELLHALDAEGAIEVADGLADTRNPSLPPSLVLTLLRRLSLLPEAVLNLLRLASILGGTFSTAELALLADQSVAQLLPTLLAARDAGVLTEAGDRLAFRHDLLREAISGDLSEAVRKGLHRQAATVLGRAGAPAERVADHLMRGADPGDAEAVAWLRRAARSSAPRTPATTIRLLERALELVEPDDAAHAEIEGELVEPLLSCGRLREAESVARRVLGRRADPRVHVMVRTGLASVLSMGARYPESIDQLRLASIAAPEGERPSLAAASAVLMVLAGQLEDAVSAATQAVDVGERYGDDYARCVGLQALAMAMLAGGDVEGAVSFGEHAVTVVRQSEDAWSGHVVPELWLGTALADSDRLSEGEAVLQAGRYRAERSGDVARLPLYHWAIADVRLAVGQWDDAVAEVEAGLALIEEDASHVGDVFAHAISAHVALHRGQLDRAGAAVREAGTSLVAGPVEVGFEWMTWISALLAEAQGEPHRALEMLSRAWDLIAPVRYLQAASRAMAPDLVRLFIAAGDAVRATEVVDELVRSAAHSDVPTARGLALRCRGLLTGDPELLVNAATAHRHGVRPLPLAAACEDAGVALGHARRVPEAAPLLEEALAVYEQLGADWDVARVRREQRALGLGPRRVATRRPTFGWESLTPTETKVVALVAQGLTNRQIAEQLFVSRRTAATHIEHVLQKLGYGNRVALAAEASRRAVNPSSTPTAPRAPGATRANRRSRPLDRPAG
jgi:DNA-binding CsgD family transcriptional regulator